MKLLDLKLVSLLIVCFALFSCVSTENRIIVAQDGSGDFKTIQEAINSCKKNLINEQVIFIKEGIYKEKLVLDSVYTHLHFIGENKENTIISYDDHVGMDGITTANSYTFIIHGDYTKFENLTIENAAGDVGQALALYLDGDFCSFKNCHLLGNQDTIYNGGNDTQQYFYQCYIEGTTDFIFGSAAAVYEDCVIHSKKNSYITAANTPQGNQYGLVFLNCKMTADENITKVYLGRPWRDYAQTVFINCELGKHILPEGWHNWSKPNREETSFYAEYNNNGPGSNTEQRVPWAHQLDENLANKYTLSIIFNDSINWIMK